jgi:hypothetical protein
MRMARCLVFWVRAVKASGNGIFWFRPRQQEPGVADSQRDPMRGDEDWLAQPWQLAYGEAERGREPDAGRLGTMGH